ncbi:hypothetical protein BDR06DRAFT_985164 [Suillus hirtellus]|nr:hypothetical protein BDR06DRAFT_985164 [Suillus hirtellus]
MEYTPLCRKQPIWEAWSLECLIHKHSINLKMTLECSTNHAYSSTLNSYITFCELHHFSLEPTLDTLSYFVMYMSAHINPQSVNNYLLGICSQLEEFYPTVHSLPLTLVDLKLVQDSLPHQLSFDDNLFLAQLMNGFHALLRLRKLFLPSTKAGHSMRAGGTTSLVAGGVPSHQIHTMGWWSSEAFCIYIQKNPMLLHSLIFNGWSTHDSGNPFTTVS